MGANKEWFVRMREEEYLSIPTNLRNRFISENVNYPDEHDHLYETDDNYRKLYSKYRTAKKHLEEYKFNKRHANSRSITRELSES